MAPKVTALTAEGHKHLLGELNNLKTVRRKEVAARIRKASETGGVVDNAEYDEAKNEQAFVEGRISDLDNILSNAVVASVSKGKEGSVQLGSSVTVENDSGSKTRYVVVGSAEAAPLEGKISVESPVGRAILGHKKGDVVKVETPSGAVKLRITAVG
jgi:transcription elongation factor GreA